MEGDDPWDWEVDRVVQELCTDDRSWQFVRGVMPEPASFEKVLRQHGIAGNLLLVDVEDNVMKTDLGLNLLSGRAYLRSAMEELRQRSPKYQMWWQRHHQNLASQYSRSIQHSIYHSPHPEPVALFGQRLPVAQPLIGDFGRNPLESNEILGASPQTPSLTHEGMSPTDDVSIERQKPSAGAFVVSGWSGNKRRKLDFTDPQQLPDDSLPDNSLMPPPAPVVSQPDTVEVNSKKQKRIAPTLITSVIDPDRNRDIPTNADNVVMFDPHNVEPGVVFTDENGRKRLIPVQADLGSESCNFIPFQNSRTDENRSLDEGEDKGLASASLKAPQQRSIQPTGNLVSGYFGKRKISVDDIFYEGTAVGKELSDSAISMELSQGFQNIPGGRRLYIQGIMKHFLRQERQVFSRGESHFAAVLPYSTKLVPKFHQPSFTLYSSTPDGKINARREAVSTWPEIDPEASFLKGQSTSSEHDATIKAIGSGAIETTRSYADWDPSCLEKYIALGGGDTVLPLYGDSDEENEYDLETWAEIEAERGTLKKPSRPLKGKEISATEVQEAIDQGIVELVRSWKETKLPKLQMKAWKIWAKSRHNNDKRHRIQQNQERLEHVKGRIFEMRKEIALDVWTSQAQVRKQTRIMELSVFEREEKAWEITVLESKVIPQRPSPQTRLESTPKAQPQIDDGEEGESIDSAPEMQSSDDEGLEDFIVADEVLSGTDRENELNLADGEDVDDDEDEDVSMSDASLPVIPKKKASRRHGKRHLFDDLESSDRDQLMADDDDTTLAISGADVHSPSHHSSPSLVKDEQPALHKLPSLTQSCGSHIVDLTMLSSDPEVVNLATPEKTPTVPSEKKRFKIRLKISSSSSPIAISDTDELDSKLDPLDLPPHNDPATIAKFSFQAWSNLHDRERLLIAFIKKELNPEARHSLFELISNTPRDKLWVRMTDEAFAMSGKEEKAKGVDAKSSSSLRTLARMLLMYIDCKYHPAASDRESTRQRLAEKLVAGEEEFPGFYQLFGKLKKNFDEAIIHQAVSQHFFDDDDSDDEPQVIYRRRLGNPMISDEEDFDHNNSPRKKRKKKIFEDAVARDLRAQDRERLAEQEERKKKLLAKLAETGGAADFERGRIIINEAKLENQGYIYVNENIGRRIKPHQISGVRFMWNQIVTDEKTMQGCLLAHTMGLGKTMQSITLLVAIAEAAASLDPSVSSQVPESLRVSKTLILCPPGLIDNWIDELLIWTPEGLLGDLRKIGPSDAIVRLRTITDWYHDGGVLIIGYEMFRSLIHNKEKKKSGTCTLSEEQHAQVLKELLEGPNIIIADEAHKMKNSAAGITTATSRFKSKSRIALTGSPLANNVEEYYAMIEWVAPNYLGPIVEFRSKYVEPIQNGLYNDSTYYERRKMLKMLGVLTEDLSPKVHRADISVLRDDLPPKTEFVITVPLTLLQRRAYSIYVRAMTSEADEVTESTLWHWLAVLVLLVNHPSCFKAKLIERKKEAVAKQSASRKDSTEGDEIIWKTGVSEKLFHQEMALLDKEADMEVIELSNKVKILCQILDASRAVGDKVLVFSQSIPTLNYLDGLFKRTGRNHRRLDGTTVMAKRQSLTKDFNSGRAELYLISTKAGGLGLNLPGANRVVIFDFQFNPVAEEQAVGRAFRIGQTKPVFVYRFVAGGTFEETVHNRAIFKMQLASRVVDKKNPVALAKKKTGDFLFEPREVEQKDLSDFKGIDDVLDEILNQKKGKDTLIRAVVKSDTFEQHDDDKLTAEEKTEIQQLIKEEKLKRDNPQAYYKELNKRNKLEVAQQREMEQQAADRHTAAQRLAAQPAINRERAQHPSNSAPLYSARLATLIRPPTPSRAVARPETPIPQPHRKPAETSHPSSPTSGIPTKSMEPILGANTRVEQSDNGRSRLPKESNTSTTTQDRTTPRSRPPRPRGELGNQLQVAAPRYMTPKVAPTNGSRTNPAQQKSQQRHEGINTDTRQSLPLNPSSPSPASSIQNPSVEVNSGQNTTGKVSIFDGVGDNSTTLKRRMFDAMSRQPVQSLKTPVTTSPPKRNRSHRNSGHEDARAKLREEDARVKARIDKKRAERNSAVSRSQELSKLPDWAHKKIEEANSRTGRGSPSTKPE